jgi:hypothetical protein
VVEDSEVVTTSFVIAHTVLKLVATLSCPVVSLPHHATNEVQDNGATFVAIYAVGILSCNLAFTVRVVVAHTAKVAKL